MATTTKSATNILGEVDIAPLEGDDAAPPAVSEADGVALDPAAPLAAEVAAGEELLDAPFAIATTS